MIQDRAYPSERALRGRAVRWAKTTGAPIRWRGKFVSRWDGKTLCLAAVSCFPIEARQIIHEVNHWRIAPPHRKALPNYGLGTGIDDNGPKLVGRRVRENEELAVTALDLDVMLQLEFPLDEIRSWLVEVVHNKRDVLRARRSLAARGLSVSETAQQLLDAAGAGNESKFDDKPSP